MGALQASIHPPRFRVVLIAMTLLAAAALWTITGSRTDTGSIAPPPAVNTDAVRNAPKPADTTTAMANARLALAQVEACQATSGTFLKCQTAAELGGDSSGLKYVATKPAAGQVNVVARGEGKAASYIIRSATADGRIFRIYRTDGFKVQRTCIMAADRSPCPVPGW